MRKTLALLLFAMALPLTIGAKTIDKPFVVPELREWKAKEGEFIPTAETKVVYPKNSPELKRVAQLFVTDYKKLLGVDLKLTEGKAKAGDISFAIGKNKKIGKEGYEIDISNRVIVKANEPVGVYWATRTLLQLAEQNEQQALPKGAIVDYPHSEIRGFMLDVGRKFSPLHFLQDYVEFMSYYKMNTFMIHLNDNGFKEFAHNDWSKTYSAFRLESDTYPGLTAEDGHYTKQEFIDLQKQAEGRFVEIIPELDVPAHSLAFAHYKPEIGSEKYGMDHLDLFKPETYEFVDGLFKEYLEGDNPVFRGKRVHIGTDEYSNKEKEVVEKFRYFTDYYIKYVESFGKQACIWGALSHAKGDTPVKSDNVLMWSWHNPYAQPDDMMEQGYELVSIPDGLVYIVPNAGYYYNYLNTKHLYENWIPEHIGGKKFDPKTPQILGGMFAVWNDHVGNGVSTKDIHHRVLPAMQTLAVKMWTGENPALPFEEFDKKRQVLSEAPGINIEGKIGKPNSLVVDKKSLRSGDVTGFTEVGFDYTVSFDVVGKKEDRNTILFSSPDSEFYLADPVKGLLGYSRDGYLFTFNHGVKEGVKEHITIKGDNENTYLYVNGKLKEAKNKETVYYNEGKSKQFHTATLVFPLEKTGQFKSSITNFKVYNYKVEN